MPKIFGWPRSRQESPRRQGELVRRDLSHLLGALRHFRHSTRDFDVASVTPGRVMSDTAKNVDRTVAELQEVVSGIDPARLSRVIDDPANTDQRKLALDIGDIPHIAKAGYPFFRSQGFSLNLGCWCPSHMMNQPSGEIAGGTEGVTG